MMDELRADLMEAECKRHNLEQRIVQLERASKHEELEKRISVLESRLPAFADGGGEAVSAGHWKFY